MRPLPITLFFIRVLSVILLSCSSLEASLHITEFLANNKESIEDEDGDASDWIEIFNSGPDPINLDGYYLTDDSGALTKWKFRGIEISERLGINRITMTKYLNIFAAEGIIQQRDIGNTHLWLVEEGIEKLQFPDDYFKVQEEYLNFLNNSSGKSVLSLIRNCMNSGANAVTLIIEVVLFIPHDTDIDHGIDPDEREDLGSCWT